MSARRTAARMLAAPAEWNRRRLQVLLAVAVVAVTAVVGGIAWSIIALLDVGSPSTRDASSAPASGAGAGGLSSPTIVEAQPGPLSTGSTGTLTIPQPTSLGEAQVATGFPRSVEGALAQLIAIDRRAIEAASIVTAQDVIASWAAPGGPTPATWSGVAAVRSLVESAGLPANGPTDVAVRLDPAMGLIRDQVVCIDFILTATVRGAAPDRVAVADCQRMVWVDGRWVIGPGEEPPTTPSLWPGTQASYDAGYQWLEVAP